MTTGSRSDDWIDAFLSGKRLLHIANELDPEMRAHLVALTYHYFGRAVDRYIFGEDSVWDRLLDSKKPESCNANWFVFATWASVTVNRDLDLRRTPAGTNRIMIPSMRRSLTSLVHKLKAADGQRISRALSWGQRTVFLCTTLKFLALLDIRKLDTVLAVPPVDLDKLIIERTTWGETEYVNRERHLVPLNTAVQQIRKAADDYKQIRNAPKAPDNLALRAVVARRILWANLLITAIEQDILDQAVNEVIDEVPWLALSEVVSQAALSGDRWFSVPREITGLQLPFKLAAPWGQVRDVWARLLTDQVLVMMLPTETLRLGRDVPPLSASEPYDPFDLDDLSTLPGNAPKNLDDDDPSPGLIAFINQFDRSSSDGRGSSAHDWRRFDERMNWAVSLMRSRQQDLSLYWCPYSTEDQRRLLHGRLPRHGADPSRFEVAAPTDGLPKAHRF